MISVLRLHAARMTTVSLRQTHSNFNSSRQKTGCNIMAISLVKCYWRSQQDTVVILAARKRKTVITSHC